MQPQVTKLDNKLTIVTAKMPSYQTVGITITIGVGGRYENMENGGVSHFLEHLLFKGTTKRPRPKLIAETIENVGGVHNASTSYEYTNYYVKVPKDHWKLGADLLADIVTDPLFDQKELDRERGVVVEEMHMRRDDPAHYVSEFTPRLLWPDSGLSNDILGPQSIIENIPRADVKDHQQKYYVPNNMVVSAAGDIDHEEFVEMISGLMGKLKPSRAYKRDSFKELSPKLADGANQRSAQTHIEIGARGYGNDDERKYPAMMLSVILGGGMSSRLFMTIREKMGLAYSIGSYFYSMKDTGMFSINGGINNQNVDKALDAIIREINKVREKPVAKKELMASKEKLIGRFQMRLENTIAVSNNYGREQLLSGKVETLDEFRDKINSVTIEDVQQVAKDLLAIENLRMGVIANDTTHTKTKFEQLLKG